MSGIALRNEQPEIQENDTQIRDVINGVNDTSAGTIRHLDLVRLVERVHRRYLDLLRGELNKLGVDDISPTQVLLLFTIGDSELAVKDILERGNYLGSNASYNLKHLVDVQYIERESSVRDRRSARIRLAEKGRELCKSVQAIDAEFHGMIAHNSEELHEVESAFRTLRRIELTWVSAMRNAEAWR